MLFIVSQPLLAYFDHNSMTLNIGHLDVISAAPVKIKVPGWVYGISCDINEELIYWSVPWGDGRGVYRASIDGSSVTRILEPSKNLQLIDNRIVSKA